MTAIGQKHRSGWVRKTRNRCEGAAVAVDRWPASLGRIDRAGVTATGARAKQRAQPVEFAGAR
jgi:hypothetical protein